MSVQSPELTIPDEATTERARDAAKQLAPLARAHAQGWIRLRVDDEGGMIVNIPAPAFRMLVDVLEGLSRGGAVTVARYDKELTTQQAAEFLGVSRPYFVKLLERGEISYRKVGTHRRVYLRDLEEYRRRDDARRDQAFRELSQLSDELGLYGDA